jgi:hypothetical protein
MPIADSPWGSYFGMFADKFGIEWMVDFDPKYNGKVLNNASTSVFTGPWSSIDFPKKHQNNRY